MKTNLHGLLFIGFLVHTVSAENIWKLDAQDEWAQAVGSSKNINVTNGQLRSTQPTSGFTSKIKSYKKKRTAKSITFKQTTAWDNWSEVPNIGTAEMDNALIFLPVKKGDYYMLGRHAAYQSKRVKGKKGEKNTWIKPKFTKEVLAKMGGYHAWHSTDMKNWKHCGPVSTKADGEWMTTAEYADGKFYLYYDRPNDQDPHLWVDDDLTDGKPGTCHGMVLNDPTNGSDCAVIRDEDGTFNIIFENWDYNNPQTHAWDAPVAGIAKSPNGIQPFVIQDHFVVDERTTPTGKIGKYKHSSSKKPLTYQIHEPEQNAYGDWTAIKVGGQYYLFCDYDPVGGHIKIGKFTSESLNNKFTFCGEFGNGHPDPSVGFADGLFYLIQQQGDVDFTSPGPWVSGVKARVGVDVSGNGKIDQWTAWQEVKETYNHKLGFARVVETAPASLDLGSLPAGFGFAFEYRTVEVDGQDVNVVMEQMELIFQ